MNRRPYRCNKYIPLCTNQSRLRSLIRIFGININLASAYSQCSDDGHRVDVDVDVKIDGSHVDEDNRNENQEFLVFHKEEEPLVYYTLHHRKDDIAGFYTSEALPLRHNQQKWAEIFCPEVLKSNATFVIIKVWLSLEEKQEKSQNFTMTIAAADESESPHSTADADREILRESSSSPQTKGKISALTRELANNSLRHHHNGKGPPDKLLFTYCVHFSGLVLVSLKNADKKFRRNSLVFQMNNEFFAAPDCCLVDLSKEQLLHNKEKTSSSLPTGYAIPNIDIVEGERLSVNSPHISRSSSPVPKTTNTPDMEQDDDLEISRVRYSEIYCPRSEIRQSYCLDTLLNIQESQRLYLQKTREAAELAADINQISVHCITNEQLRRKRRTISSSLSSSLTHTAHHSMGRKLSILLAENEAVDPHTLLRVQSLRKELESVRCRRSILQNEHESYSRKIARLRQRLVDLAAERQTQEKSIETHRSEEQAIRVALQNNYQSQLDMLQHRRSTQQQADKRVATLCLELREIYPIDRNRSGFYTICGVLFPNIEAYINDPKYASNIILEHHVSPLALSASFSYVAHLVHMVSVITDIPLRNPIVHDKAGTRIIDKVRDIPYSAREFPLYTRSTIPSKALKYATFLLNQNIAQLCYDITGLRCDFRATIENLLHIFAIFIEVESNDHFDIHNNRLSFSSSISGSSKAGSKRTQTHPNNRLLLPQTLSNQSLKTSASSTNGSINNFQDASSHCNVDLDEIDIGDLSKSHSSVDMRNAPQPPRLRKLLPTTQPKPIHERNVPLGNIAAEQRVSRSVGSYTDSEEDFRDINNHCYSNSDSNIVFRNE